MPLIADRIMPDQRPENGQGKIVTYVPFNPSLVAIEQAYSPLSSPGNPAPSRGILPTQDMTDVNVTRFNPDSPFFTRSQNTPPSITISSGAQTVNQNFLQSTTVGTSNDHNIIWADLFPGVNGGAQISAAISAVLSRVPAAGGTVDARGLLGAQQVTSTITVGTVSQPITLLLGNSTYTCTSSPGFIVPTGSRIIGYNANESILVKGATGNTIPLRLVDFSNTSDSEMVGVGLKAYSGVLLGGDQLLHIAGSRNHIHNCKFSDTKTPTNDATAVGTVTWQANTIYTIGTLIVDSNGTAQVVTTIGTSGNAHPAWSVTPGGTTADGAGTLVWTNASGNTCYTLGIRTEGPAAGPKISSISRASNIVTVTFNLAWQAAHAYALGVLIVDSNGNAETVTTAPFPTGNSGGGAPAWNVTVGGTTVDNQITWTNNGTFANYIVGKWFRIFNVSDVTYNGIFQTATVPAQNQITYYQVGANSTVNGSGQGLQDPSDGNIYDDNVFEGISWIGVTTAGACRENELTNNYFHGVQEPFDWNGDVGGTSGVGDPLGAIIANNTIEGCGARSFLQSSSKIIVDSNVFLDNTLLTLGQDVNFFTAAGEISRGVTVVNNQFINSSGYGVSIAASVVNFKISDNYFENCYLDGINFTADSSQSLAGQIQDNYFYNNGKASASALTSTIVAGPNGAIRTNATGPITSVTRTGGNLATVTSVAHGLTTGQCVWINGVTVTGFNTTASIITKTGNDTFTYASIGANVTSSGGTFNGLTLVTVVSGAFSSGLTYVIAGVTDTSFNGTHTCVGSPAANTLAYQQLGAGSATSGSGTVKGPYYGAMKFYTLPGLVTSNISIQDNQLYDDQSPKTQTYGVAATGLGFYGGFTITNNDFSFADQSIAPGGFDIESVWSTPYVGPNREQQNNVVYFRSPIDLGTNAISSLTELDFTTGPWSIFIDGGNNLGVKVGANEIFAVTGAGTTTGKGYSMVIGSVTGADAGGYKPLVVNGNLQDLPIVFNNGNGGALNWTIFNSGAGSAYGGGTLNFTEGGTAILQLAASGLTIPLTTGQIVLGASAHQTGLNFPAPAAATATLTFPSVTDVMVARASTDILTNKTYDTAGAGNVFRINGTQINTVSGTGTTVLLSAAPAIITTVSFFGAGQTGQTSVTGSRAGNAALASLLTAMAGFGLIVDNTVV